MRTFKTNMNQLHELITDDNPPLNHVTNEPCGVVVLQHHEGITHKGDLFTKFLEPIKFQKGLGLIKMGEAKLPPPLKKGEGHTVPSAVWHGSGDGCGLGQ